MCPKQEGFVLNRVRISNPQRLTSTQILLEYPPPGNHLHSQTVRSKNILERLYSLLEYTNEWLTLLGNSKLLIKLFTWALDTRVTSPFLCLSYRSTAVSSVIFGRGIVTVAMAIPNSASAWTAAATPIAPSWVTSVNRNICGMDERRT